MPSFIYRIGVPIFLLLLSQLCHAQKMIVISDSLAATAELLKVKIGNSGIGKIPKYSFGDYRVVSGRAGWTTSTTKRNFLGTKEESNSSQKFSFVLTGKTGDSVLVNAVHNSKVQSIQQIEILHTLWGRYELLQDVNNFSASINLSSDTSETWALFINMVRGTNTNPDYETFLTNGKRYIFLHPASSNVTGQEKPLVPAQGFELTEEGRPVAALQYHGAGLLGRNNVCIWLDQKSDPKMNLVLAGALTAVLQYALQN